MSSLCNFMVKMTKKHLVITNIKSKPRQKKTVNKATFENELNN